MKNGSQAKIGATPGRKVYAVDLFCGAGGLTHGLVKAGVDVRLGVDIDPACEHLLTQTKSEEKCKLSRW